MFSAVGVSKAINQFKARSRQTLNSQQSDTVLKPAKEKTENEAKVKKLIKETVAPVGEKLEKVKKEHRKKRRDLDGPIGPMKESKNVFKLSKAVAKKDEDTNETDDTHNR